MQIYQSYTEADTAFASWLRDEVAALGHEDAPDIPSADLVLSVLSPDAVMDSALLATWDATLAHRKPVLFTLARECSVPPRFTRITFIDFTREAIAARTDALARLQAVFTALAQPALRSGGAAADSINIAIDGDLSGELNVAAGDMIIDRRAIYLGDAPTAEERISQRNRQLLLEKVRQFWIEGVLERSIHGVAMLEIGAQESPDAVEHPWELVLDTFGEDQAQTFPPGTPVDDLFDQVGKALLILGDPGAGKTTMLLQIGRAMINRAEADPQQPVPVVFNLTSWGEERESIAGWLVEELNQKYQVPARFGAQWVANGELLLLLDGLDELPAEHQGECVAAINRFREEHGLVPLVVTSRTTEYRALDVKLHLYGAIILQQLTGAQVDDYLAEAGPDLAALRSALAGDNELQDMARTPLMLSVMVMAYQGASVDDLLGLNTPDERRRHVFESYVERMFQRYRGDQSIEPEQTRNTLTWLAQQMQSRAQSVFLIERMDRSWLPATAVGGYRRNITLVILLLVTVLFGINSLLGTGIDILQQVGPVPRILGSRTVAFLMGMLRGTIFYLLLFRQRPTGRWQRVLGLSLLFWLPLMMVLGGIDGILDSLILQDGETLFHSAVIGMGAVLITPFMFSLVLSQASQQPDATEALQWQLSDAVRGGAIGLGLGILMSVIMTIQISLLTLVEVPFIREIDIGTLIALELVAAFFLLVQNGLLLLPMAIIGGALMYGLSGRQVEETTQPNQGIRHATRNAFRVGLLFVVVISIVLTISVFISLMTSFLFSEEALASAVLAIAGTALAAGLSYGLQLGLAEGFIFGGRAALRHWSLRRVLARKGLVPRRLVPFLDHAVDLVFLRRVGGGYIFAHRALLEHFVGSEQGDAVQMAGRQRIRQ